jgi:hypothetical protein
MNTVVKSKISNPSGFEPDCPAVQLIILVSILTQPARPFQTSYVCKNLKPFSYVHTEV